MADEKLAEELAKHLAKRDSRRSLFPDHLDAIGHVYRVEYRRAARAALEWLAERGRLVPDGAKVEEQWSVLFGDGFRAEYADKFHARAVLSHPAYRTNGRLYRRTITMWPDETQLTTPWVAVQPEPAQEETPDA